MTNANVEPEVLGLFGAAARAYMHLVRGPTASSASALLIAVELQLLELYRVILRIPLAFPDDDRPNDPLPIDEVNRIRDRLRALLGNADYYRAVFDPYAPESDPPVVSSLAQDLAEIYGDLYRGVSRWENQNFLEAQYEWRFGFDFHWGRHLVQALGAIHALHSDHSWDVPPLADREA